MLDIQSMIRGLKRPQLLVQTARCGLDGYRRHIHLRRILGLEELPGPAKALVLLLELERFANDDRMEGYAGYKASRHVEILIAIMAEARTLRDARAEQASRPPLSKPVA